MARGCLSAVCETANKQLTKSASGPGRARRHRGFEVASQWEGTNIVLKTLQLRRFCPTLACTKPVCIFPERLVGASQPPRRPPPSWLSPANSPGCSWPLPRPQCHGCHSTSLSSTTTEVTARAQIARACLGLVLQSCLRIPLECMQGGRPLAGTCC